MIMAKAARAKAVEVPVQSVAFLDNRAKKVSRGFAPCGFGIGTGFIKVGTGGGREVEHRCQKSGTDLRSALC